MSAPIYITNIFKWVNDTPPRRERRGHRTMDKCLKSGGERRRGDSVNYGLEEDCLGISGGNKRLTSSDCIPCLHCSPIRAYRQLIDNNRSQCWNWSPYRRCVLFRCWSSKFVNHMPGINCRNILNRSNSNRCQARRSSIPSPALRTQRNTTTTLRHARWCID